MSNASGSSSIGGHATIPPDGHPGIAAAVFTFLGIAALLFVGMGIVSECQAEPTCVATCQDDCYGAFYRNWAAASLALVVITILAVKTIRWRAPLVVVPATIAAGALLIVAR